MKMLPKLYRSIFSVYFWAPVIQQARLLSVLVGLDIGPDESSGMRVTHVKLRLMTKLAHKQTHPLPDHWDSGNALMQEPCTMCTELHHENIRKLNACTF
jgi:hypothetical protein